MLSIPDRKKDQPETVGGSWRVVLVRPRGGANVGAVCRAMKNMDACDLVIVGAGSFDVEQARRMAVHASDILDARREVATLREAISGCGVVVGTTVRGGGYRSRSRDIRGLAAELACVVDERPGAFVFGPEDSGLDNEEISMCQQLAVIPTAAGYRSLNLAQAVLIALYESYRARCDHLALDARHCVETGSRPADAGDVEDMFCALEQALLAIGFLCEDNPRHVMAALRSLLARASIDERELRILRGIARQVEWFAAGGFAVAAAKRARGEKLR